MHFCTSVALQPYFAPFGTRAVAGVDNLGAAQAVFSRGDGRCAVEDGGHEVVDDINMTTTGLDVGDEVDGRAVGFIIKNPYGFDVVVVDYFELGATFRAVQNNPKIVAIGTMSGPAGFELERGTAVKPDHGRGQVFDFVLASDRLTDAVHPFLATGPKFGVGSGIHCYRRRFTHQIHGDIEHMHAQINQRTATSHVFVDEPTIDAGDAGADFFDEGADVGAVGFTFHQSEHMIGDVLEGHVDVTGDFLAFGDGGDEIILARGEFVYG